MRLDDKEKFYAVLKALVVKPLVNISRAKGIFPGLDVQYSSAKNTNYFKLTWDYEDSDGIKVYTTDLIDSTVYEYESGFYAGADLSFELIIKTKKYGIFKEVLPWGLTK